MPEGQVPFQERGGRGVAVSVLVESEEVEGRAERGVVELCSERGRGGSARAENGVDGTGGGARVELGGGGEGMKH